MDPIDFSLSAEHEITGGLLDCPQTRTLTIAKKSILHTAGQGGTTAEWIQHFWLSGAFDFPHMSWEAAELLMKAYATEQSEMGAAEFPEEAPVVLLAVFSHADPYFWPIRITSPIEFPHVGEKIGLAHRATIQWETIQSVSSMRFRFTPIYTGGAEATNITGFSVEALEDAPAIEEIWYAHEHETLRSW